MGKLNYHYQGKNEPLSNILGYIAKAVKNLGYTLIALFIMVLFTPLVYIFSEFTHSSPWFWLPDLITITFLIFRLNKSKKLLVFFSLFIFYTMYVSNSAFERGCPNGEYTINREGMIFYK